MRITAIKQQVKQADRVSVFVDDKYTFSLSKSQLVAAGFRVGDAVNQAQILNFLTVSEVGKIKEKAAKWAMQRPHSTREISSYLSKKLPDDEVAYREVYEYLVAAGFVDDKVFTEAWVRSRRQRGYSRYVIKVELIKKGVADEVIEEFLGGDEENMSALETLIAKNRSKYPDKQKLMAYLASKGYSYDLIKEALNN